MSSVGVERASLSAEGTSIAASILAASAVSSGTLTSNLASHCQQTIVSAENCRSAAACGLTDSSSVTVRTPTVARRPAARGPKPNTSHALLCHVQVTMRGMIEIPAPRVKTNHMAEPSRFGGITQSDAIKSESRYELFFAHLSSPPRPLRLPRNARAWPT